MNKWIQLPQPSVYLGRVTCDLQMKSGLLSTWSWPFAEATHEVSAEKYISVSKVIPLVSLLLGATAASERQGSSFATELAQRRFRGIETLHSLTASTFLDIRFKHLAFRDKDHVEAVKKRLLSEMQDVHSAAAPLEATSTSVLRSVSEPAVCASSVTVTPPVTPYIDSSTAKGGIWGDFDLQVISAQQQQSGSSDSVSEMRRYAEVPRNQDPFFCWGNHEQTFPALSKLAKKISWVQCIICPFWENVFPKQGSWSVKEKTG